MIDMKELRRQCEGWEEVGGGWVGTVVHPATVIELLDALEAQTKALEAADEIVKTKDAGCKASVVNKRIEAYRAARVGK